MKRVEVGDVREVFAILSAPDRVSAAMPELRYEWACGCRVVVDSDLLERRWDRCASHAVRLLKVRRIA